MARIDTDAELIFWQLEDRESIEAQILTDLQVLRIKNIIYLQTLARFNLDLSPSAPLEFIQQEAFIKGKIAVLKELLDYSEEAKQQIVQETN